MDLVDFFRSGGPLAEVMPGYRPRVQQLDMASYVQLALSHGAPLLADAKTGTGKSLAYLVPVALSGEPVVISTSTKALQHQLVEKDLPALVAAMKAVGLTPPTYALLKGRSNYLCQARHDAWVDGGFSLAEKDEAEKVAAWRSQTYSGDLETLKSATPRFWGDIASDSDDCHRKSCPYSQECFYFKARDEAVTADILVTNHHLLWANLASHGGVFEMEGRSLILDEAHNLERSMMDAYGVQVTRHRVRYNLRAVARRTTDLGEYLDSARANGDAFFEELHDYQDLHDEDDAPPSYGMLVMDLVSIKNLVKSNPAEAVNKLSDMLSNLIDDLRHFYSAPKDTHAYAIQRPAHRGAPPSLKSWLVGPGDVFREEVLNRREAVVLTSATLAVGRSFDYPRQRLGFDQYRHQVYQFMGEEVFDYRKNALCYVASDLPAPQGKQTELHTQAVIQRTAELVKISGGRALVLLATHRALNAFIKSSFSMLVPGYPVRFQGQHGTPGQLVTWLKDTPGAVLVGTRSFWEGVDIPGENLSLVIIDKTPFPVPVDPLVVKLTELAEARGGNGFYDVSIPWVQTLLQQGAGRLIRTTTDRGVIALLDPRIAEKSWGRRILKALPQGVPTSTDLEDVAAFFGSDCAA